jgi:hypothetical protein
MESCLFSFIVALLCSAPAENQAIYYGEPVELKGNYIYFTSWKYVRQGNIGWKIQTDESITKVQKEDSAWLKGDGIGAIFQPTDMPHGIRLVAQKAQKIPFKSGQIAAQVFDEGKYKAWYTVNPCAEPEPFALFRILIG